MTQSDHDTMTPHGLMKKLWPICRSLTGDGVRETFSILKNHIPLEMHEIPSGTQCFDWTVPPEWNIRNAYIETLDGRRIVDMADNNLHVLNYSVPINQEVSRQTLFEHLHTLPDFPEAIPYVTSYYKEDWGFCVSQEFKDQNFQEENYRVVIDSTKEPGHLTYGDLVLPGSSDQEVLFSTYVCHPSMANNELSGPVVATFLYQYLSQLKERKYTYRFIFVPETIGSIAYLQKHGTHLKEKLVAGFVLTCCGDEGKFTYKKSRDGNTLTDRITLNALKYLGLEHKVVEFFPSGSDERQYCSPGFNLPVGSLMKTMYAEYKEYHTSKDDLTFVTEKGLAQTIEVYQRIIDGLEINDYYINQSPFCEPQLGKRGLYPGHLDGEDQKTFNIWYIQFLLNFSDGHYDLIDIANKLETPVFELKPMLKKLLESSLLK